MERERGNYRENILFKMRIKIGRVLAEVPKKIAHFRANVRIRVLQKAEKSRVQVGLVQALVVLAGRARELADHQQRIDYHPDRVAFREQYLCTRWCQSAALRELRGELWVTY
jgi:hypothetical protein